MVTMVMCLCVVEELCGGVPLCGALAVCQYDLIESACDTIPWIEGITKLEKP